MNHVTRTVQWERPTRSAYDYHATRPESGVVQRAEPSLSSSVSSSPPSSISSSPCSIASSCRTTTDSSSSGEDPITHRLRERRDRRHRRQSARHQSFLNRTLIHGAQAPENFDRKTTPQGQVYFVNRITGQTTWHDPQLPRDTSFLTEQELGALPDGWELRNTASGRVYYVDHHSRTTQFTGEIGSKIFIISSIFK